VFVEAGRKRGLLTELFAEPIHSRVLVFTRTKRGADKVARILEGGGVEAAAIHGNKSQAQRERALAEFKAGKVRALVATDIAARGIDVSSVSHVVQYELPDVPEQYVHRIGRTARAGQGWLGRGVLRRGRTFTAARHRSARARKSLAPIAATTPRWPAVGQRERRREAWPWRRSRRIAWRAATAPSATAAAAS
jgi:superfamily II DNA/RNA helicase